MHIEATIIDIQTQFTADDKIRLNQLKKIWYDQGCMVTAWDAFKYGDTTPKEVLTTVSSIYTLGVSI